MERSVTHTLFVCWTAVYTNGLEVNGESVYKGPMDSGADIGKMKAWIVENDMIRRDLPYGGGVLSYLVVNNVASLLVEETVLAEDVK